MKEKIDLFARGVFKFERPSLRISVDSINISVESGKSYGGSFTVSSSDDTSFKGILYSSSGLLTFEKDTFVGSSNLIHFSFDAGHLDCNDQNLDRNDRLKGRIFVVTELGESCIPFKVSVRPPVCDTSIGPASDLFHFASLAQTNWSEAKNLFKSGELNRIFSYSDPKFETLSRALMRSANISVAMEEFLTATHKKLPVMIMTDDKVISYDIPPASGEGSLVLKKDNWGYSQLSVSTEGDFLSTGVQVIWTEDFDGNIYTLKFHIDAAALHAGVNEGAIIIKSVRQTLRIPVTVKNIRGDLKPLLDNRRRRHLEAALMSGYLDYRCGLLMPPRYAAETEKTLDTLKVLRPERLPERLLRIYLMLLVGKNVQAETALGVISEDEDWKGMKPFYLAAVIYLEAMDKGDPAAESDAYTRLRDMFEREGDPMIFLLSMDMDKRRRMSNSTRFDTLRRTFDGRAVSVPVLFEAVLIINEDPTVLKEFGGFDLQVANFGIKYDLLSRNAALQLSYLAVKAKNSSRLGLSFLRRCYGTFKTTEVLEALCTHLIMQGAAGERDFDIYRQAVLEQVDVRDLYENCLQAAGDSCREALPRQLVTYFSGSDLPGDRSKAAFYANLVSHRPAGEELPSSMLYDIRSFTLSMLSKGQISSSLAILYNNVLKADDITPEFESCLPDIVFKYLARTDWEGAEALLVLHKEQDSECRYELQNGAACIDIYTEDAQILIVDAAGNRIASGNIETERLITNQDLIRICNETCGSDEKVMLHLLDEARYKGTDDSLMDLVRGATELTSLEKGFAIRCYCELVDYFYDKGEGELMESYLVRLDLAVLDRPTRSHMLELMILRDLYSLAMTNIEHYGFTGVDIKRLSKLADKLLEVNSPQTGSSCFLDMCSCIFRKRKCTERILAYLVRNFTADSESMYMLWEQAAEAGVDASDMEERLLETVLFTECEMSYGREVFKHYYGHSSPNRLIRAFLSYYAYGYLACNRVPDQEMLELMRREANYEENDICMLALLKYYSGQSSFTDAEHVFIERQMDRMEAKGLIFPFFRNFPSSFRIPAGMADKCYVEYHTDPSKRVRIHYMHADSGSDSYISEDMKDLGYGIFVREFVIFCGEVLQYYITEEQGDSCVITEASQLSIEMDAMSEEESRYHRLNLIITARELNDNKTLQKMLEHYIHNEYMVRHLFKPIL